MERFGLPFNYDVECFESLNKISRWAIQHSNNTDDSQSALDYWIKRDTHTHVLSGGYWIDRSGSVHKPGVLLQSDVDSRNNQIRPTIVTENNFYKYRNQVLYRNAEGTFFKVYIILSNNEFQWPELYITETVVQKTDSESFHFEIVSAVCIHDIYYHNEFA